MRVSLVVISCEAHVRCPSELATTPDTTAARFRMWHFNHEASPSKLRDSRPSEVPKIFPCICGRCGVPCHMDGKRLQGTPSHCSISYQREPPRLTRVGKSACRLHASRRRDLQLGLCFVFVRFGRDVLSRCFFAERVRRQRDFRLRALLGDETCCTRYGPELPSSISSEKPPKLFSCVL